MQKTDPEAILDIFRTILPASLSFLLFAML